MKGWDWGWGDGPGAVDVGVGGLSSVGLPLPGCPNQIPPICVYVFEDVLGRGLVE